MWSNQIFLVVLITGKLNFSLPKKIYFLNPACTFCYLIYIRRIQLPTLFNRIHTKKINLEKFPKKTVSTLLIPNHLTPKLTQILPHSVSKNGSLIPNFAQALHLLLRKYKGLFACGELPFQQKPKLSYQSDDLDLKVFKFRPNNADWFELGIIAYGLGVSRCWLFTYMLELELSGIGEFLEIERTKDVVTTPRHSRPRMIHQITGKRHYINRTLHFRI
jgi:hypothetical protein